MVEFAAERAQPQPLVFLPPRLPGDDLATMEPEKAIEFLDAMFDFMKTEMA